MTPYLGFEGACAEAFALYERLFGGTLRIMRYGEAPEQPPGMIEEDGARIMHAELRGPDWAVMGADLPPGSSPQDMHRGGNVLHLAPTVAEGERLHRILAKGGAIVMPFAPTLLSPGFGISRDRFGITWMIGTAEG